MIEQLFSQLKSHAVIVLILWLIPLIAYAVDLWTGIEAAQAQKEKINSSGFRRTVNKIGEYWRFQLMAVLVDVIGSFLPFYVLPYVSMLATISIILIEFRSVKENFKKKKSNVVDAMDLGQKFAIKIANAKDEKEALELIADISAEINPN